MKWPWQKAKAAIKWPNRPKEGEQIGEDTWIQYSGSLGGTSTADAIPAAYAAINLLTNQMSMLQPCVFNPDGEIDNDFSISSVLMYPSRTLDSWQFWQLMWRVYFTHGNSFALIQRNSQGVVEQLVPAWCNDARYVDSGAGLYVMYRLELLGANSKGGLVRNRYVEVPARDVITFHGPGYDANMLMSPSPVRYAAANMVSLIKGVTRHQGKLTEGALSSGSVLTIAADQIMASSKKRLDEFKEILVMINESVKSSKENKTLPVLPPGVSIDRMQTLTNEDLQLVELLKWGVEDIARVWCLPPARLGHYYRGYRQVEIAPTRAEFVHFSIGPPLTMGTCQLTRKMLSPKMITQGYTIGMPTDDLKKGTFQENTIAVKTAVADGGFMTPNEGRARLGLKPIPGGDKLLQPKGAPKQNEGEENDED